MVCNKEEEVTEAKGKVDKLKLFKEQQGVYVGESARSIFERAKEHHHDTLEKSEESLMVKHWRISHPELEEPPKFNIKVVASFRDPLSRQLSEAIRIDLRGGNVLNSKSEYTRCKIPRLVINKEEWEKNAEEKRKKEKEEMQKIEMEKEGVEKMEKALKLRRYRSLFLSHRCRMLLSFF